MKLLIVTSEELYPGNVYNSSFELSLARGLQQAGVDVALLSVYMITPWNLLKAIFIKALFSFKKNSISQRFTFRHLSGFLFSYLLEGKRYFVLRHNVNRSCVFEAVGISRIVNENAEIFGREWVKAGITGFDIVKQSGQFDLIHGHSRFYFGISLAYAIHKQYGLPYIITEHSSFYSRGLVSAPVLRHLKEIYDHSAAAVAVSRSLADKVKEVTGTEQEIGVVANALDAVYEETEPGREMKKGFTIISVGRFDDNKNQALLIRAFAKAAIPGSTLILVGVGETEQTLRSVADTLHLKDRIHFKGHLPLARVRELMLKADVLAVSSKVETFSVVTIEAHACGLPVVSTPCGGPNELIGEENGILLKGFTDSEMAEALHKVHQNYGLYNKALIRKKAIEKFSANAIAGEYIRLYHNVTDKKSS